MTSRPNTRGLTCRPQAKVHNENMSRPPLPGRATASGLLRDTTGKILGLKRKADANPEGAKDPKKRSAFGDITNAIEKKLTEGKKSGNHKGSRLMRSTSTVSLAKAAKVGNKKEPVQLSSIKVKGDPLTEVNKELARKKNEQATDFSKPELSKDLSFCDSLPSSQDTVASLETNKTDLDDSAAYVTASEGRYCQTLHSDFGCGSIPLHTKVLDRPAVEELPVEVPQGVEDYDLEMKDDPTAVANYANDIFKYYKEREKQFQIEKYIERQPDVMRSMRAILVDWMVEVQESFELNHETLYLGVKILDLYLTKVIIKRDILQLVGSTALFIACKFDERTPPYVDDFLYICDDAYKRKELIAMEIKILKEIGFDLGIPLSYRFLRRYARCAKVPMEDLTFTRYILEMSLMDYELIDASDSALAAAALLLSRSIKGDPTWTPTLEYYSGYKMEDIYHLTQVLHNMISQPPKDHLKTIRNKYSHKVFYEVAKIPIPDKLAI